MTDIRRFSISRNELNGILAKWLVILSHKIAPVKLVDCVLAFDNSTDDLLEFDNLTTRSEGIAVYTELELYSKMEVFLQTIPAIVELNTPVPEGSMNFICLGALARNICKEMCRL